MANSITTTVQNPKADNKAVIFIGTSATLHVSLQNDTGADITLDATSQIEIYMPFYFSSVEVGNMVIQAIAPADWAFSHDPQHVSLLLKYTGSSKTWAAGDKLTFDIATVLSNGKATTDSIQFNFTGMQGTNIPSQLSTPLVLNNPVVPKEIPITDVLQVNLDNQGTVFVSVQTDPLTNTIFLNLKNATDGPLYDGKSIWKGTPEVTVTFVYGTTSGSLAPDQKSSATSLGSAWKISGSVYVDQTAGWGIANPKASGQQNSPSWLLTPNSTNLEIIGTGDKSNVTFAFSNVVSLTPAGNTQMYVQFTGFTKNDQTTYQDHLYVLNISKLPAPITRGMINFFSPQSVVALTKPESNIEITLRWAMFYVYRIQLISNIPVLDAPDKTYPDAPPVNSDHATITVPAKISQDTPVFLTLQAYDPTGGFLNAVQFSVFLAANFFYDPRDQQVYPTVRVNNQVWMAANLNYQAPTGSVSYGNNTGNEKTYGMLYTASAAQSTIPAGWRLPTQADWDSLIASQDKQGKAYANLMQGGSSGFNAVLGGYGDNLGHFHDGPGDPNGQTGGNYWTHSPDDNNSGNFIYALFDATYSKVNTKNSNPETFYLSVRYVKNT